jgi:hypothetical protein
VVVARGLTGLESLVLEEQEVAGMVALILAVIHTQEYPMVLVIISQ